MWVPPTQTRILLLVYQAVTADSSPRPRSISVYIKIYHLVSKLPLYHLFFIFEKCKNFEKKFLLLLRVCVMGVTYATRCKWRSEGSFVVSAFSFHPCGFWGVNAGPLAGVVTQCAILPTLSQLLVISFSFTFLQIFSLYAFLAILCWNICFLWYTKEQHILL